MRGRQRGKSSLTTTRVTQNEGKVKQGTAGVSDDAGYFGVWGNQQRPRAVLFEQQGGRAQVKVPQDPSKASVGGRRGVITKFTRASRRRMFGLLNSINWPVELLLCVMTITLTYHNEWPVDSDKQWRELKEFCRRMGFRWVIWRREFQKRGAVHWHLIVGGVTWKAGVLRVWREVVGDLTITEVHVGLVGSLRRLLWYVSKYHAKIDDKEVGYAPRGGPVPAEGRSGPPLTLGAYPEKGVSIGRAWGMIGRENAVWYERIRLILTWGPWVAKAKRCFRRLTGVSTRSWGGFNAFGEVGTWFEYVMWQVRLGETEVLAWSGAGV